MKAYSRTYSNSTATKEEEKEKTAESHMKEG